MQHWLFRMLWTDSIIARLRRRILSHRGISLFFMFFLMRVMSCKPCCHSWLNSDWEI